MHLLLKGWSQESTPKCRHCIRKRSHIPHGNRWRKSFELLIIFVLFVVLDVTSSSKLSKFKQLLSNLKFTCVRSLRKTKRPQLQNARWYLTSLTGSRNYTTLGGSRTFVYFVWIPNMHSKCDLYKTKRSSFVTRPVNDILRNISTEIVSFFISVSLFEELKIGFIIFMPI